ncbi:MAG TPA: hypothetical protein VMQ93_00265 [Novosphingobium sp.]|nr:hypothetical protein [Novosphingobium sp.]
MDRMSAEYFPQWEREGFASRPEEFVAGGSEIILRAYCNTIDTAHDFVSRKIGSCFFVPACGRDEGPVASFTLDRALWTGAFLEQRLNAFVFGNAYERLGVWALNPGTRYRIGFVGFDTRTTVAVAPEPEYGPITLYRHTFAAGDDPRYFRQVVPVLDLPPNHAQLPDKERFAAFEAAVLKCVRLVDDVAIVLPLTTHIGHA